MKKTIIEVERAACSGSTAITPSGYRTATAASHLQWEAVQAKTPAQMTITEKIEDKNRVYSAELSFKTPCRQSFGGRYVWRARLLSGEWLVLGTGARPYPVATVEERMPENVADSQMDVVTVSYSSTTPIPCLN